LKALSEAEYRALIAGAEVLAADAHGDKVLRTPRGEIVKLFRRKRLWSSAMWRPYALRFGRNAELLRAEGIPTVEVLGIHRVPAIERDIVVYRELPGHSLRDALQNRALSPAEKTALLARFGALVGVLHARGILFRSIHFANVLIGPDGRLALIDVADMRKRLWGALNVPQRVRNFQHMLRYEVDRYAMLELGIPAFVEAYLPQSAFAPTKEGCAALSDVIQLICRPQK
jgi:tRNA A-37 threonylcarbamoyl transferase component Bud32